jgi:cytochrome c biogenesis protein CcmG, thiol:disulfide interchange protein DsbE
MTPRRLILVLVVAAAVAALLVVGLGSAGSASGRKAPALPTQVLHPPRVTLASLRGHPVVLNFWASWCGPCRKEAPELVKLHRELPKDARLVGVDWNDGESGARAFLGRSGWTYPNLRDGSGDVGNSYRLHGMPTTFLLDKNGRIREQLTGPQTAAGILVKLRSL